MLGAHCPPSPKLEEVEFQQLNVSCLGIRVIDHVKPTFWFISHLYLDHNALRTLNGIAQFTNLETLSFNFNHVSGLWELQKIKNKFFMIELSFVGNPLQSQQKCTEEYLTLHLFRNLRHLNRAQRFKESRSRNTRERTRAKSTWQTERQEQDITERYQQNRFSLYPASGNSHKTKRDHKQHRYDFRDSDIYESTKKFVRSSSRVNQSMQSVEQVLSKKPRMSSTGVNTGGFSQTNYTFQRSRRDKHERSGYLNPDVKPFDSVYEDLNSQEDNSAYLIQREEEISRSQNSKEEMPREQTGRFKSGRNKQYANYRSPYYAEQEEEEYPLDVSEQIGLTAQFLQWKKMQIAIAFRMRFIKERSFKALVNEIKNKKIEQKIAYRKAWGLLKMVGVFKEIDQRMQKVQSRQDMA